MTLIAGYFEERLVGLVGDLMLSRNGRNEEFELPLRAGADFHTEFPTLAGLYQKIVLITPTLAVAWAGSWLTARSIIREVSENFNPPYTREGLISVLEAMNLPSSERNSVSLLFAYFRSIDAARFTVESFEWQINTTIISEDPLRLYKCAGTGEYHFLNLSFNPTGSSGDNTPETRSLHHLVERAAVAFYHEAVSNDLYWFAYGGGFEIVHIDVARECFVKIPLTYVFWNQEADDFNANLAITQEYLPAGILLSRRLSLNRGGSYEQSHLFVENFLTNLQETLSPPSNFQSGYSIHYFREARRPDHFKIATNAGWDPRFRLRLTPDSYTIEMRPEFLNEIPND